VDMKKIIFLMLMLTIQCSNSVGRNPFGKIRDPLSGLDDFLSINGSNQLNPLVGLVAGPEGGSYKAYYTLDGVMASEHSYTVIIGGTILKKDKKGKKIYEGKIISSEIRNDWCNEGTWRFGSCSYFLIRTTAQEIKIKTLGITLMKDATGFTMLTKIY
jgi:hypothetical protein